MSNGDTLFHLTSVGCCVKGCIQRLVIVYIAVFCCQGAQIPGALATKFVQRRLWSLGAAVVLASCRHSEALNFYASARFLEDLFIIHVTVSLIREWTACFGGQHSGDHHVNIQSVQILRDSVLRSLHMQGMKFHILYIATFYV